MVQLLIATGVILPYSAGGATFRLARFAPRCFETALDMTSARQREREIKGMTRREKEALIDSVNKSWQDLSVE